MEATMARRKSSQAGFSLAELLVAILILAVGLLGLAEMQIAAMHDNSLSGAALGANSVAQAAIEEIMAINPKRPQLPVDSNPLYEVIHVPAKVDQAWPDILIAVDADYVVRAVTEVPGSGSFVVTYTTDPGCPTPGGAFGIGATFTNVTVSVVSQGDRFNRARATLSTVKNCSM
jgi:prepilin-type N-terminal cleavage/methylation domain-containing protein